MQCIRTKGAFGLLMATLVTGVTLPAQERFITEGHVGLAVDYVPGEGWRSYLHDYDTGNRLAPATTIYRIGEEALAEVPEDGAYSLLGDPGDRIWVVPEIYNPEILYLGIGAPLLGRNIFTGGLSNRGQVTMRLVSVSGSGPESGGTLTMWQSGFPPRFHFSTADGIGPGDSLEAITANFHAHYNWAFTQPGLYRVTFEYSGTLLPALGGGFTSTEVTYSFDIGEPASPSALRYAWPLGDGWSWSSWMGTVYTANAPWILSDAHGWIFLLPSHPESAWVWTFAHGWAWTSQFYFPWLWRYRDGQWINP